MKGTLEERFWAKVDKSGERWEWTAYKNASGYGQIEVTGSPLPSHRVSWHLAKGRNPRAEATHCKNGHLLSGDNLGITPSTGKRYCRTCMK